MAEHRSPLCDPRLRLPAPLPTPWHSQDAPLRPADSRFPVLLSLGLSSFSHWQRAPPSSLPFRGHTYVHNEEIEPAPGIGEVLLEAIGHPLEQHLQHEDVGEHLVGILQQDLDGLPLLQVDVLEGLQTRVDKADMIS